MPFQPSKLFHAVVITGAALAGCAGNQRKPQTPGDTAANPPATPNAPTASNGTCPPGSERPFPPCYWIL